jgi:hypothetical protein
MVWGYISHLIHFPNQKSHVVKWSGINIVAGVISLCIVAFPFDWKPVVLMAVAITRSVVDYWLGWKFYFPDPAAPAASV